MSWIAMSESEWAPGEWDYEQIRQRWLSEMEARFEAENQNFRAYELREIEVVKQRGLLHRLPERDHEPHNSSLYTLWAAAEVKVERNVAEVLFPPARRIDLDVVTMFTETEAAWSTVEIIPVVVDGIARIMLQTILVSYWDDALSAEWKAAHPTYAPPVTEIIERYAKIHAEA